MWTIPLRHIHWFKKREGEQSQMEKSMGSCDDCVRCDGTVQDLSSACFNRKTIKSSAFEHKNTFWGKQPLQVFTVLNLRKTQFMVSLLSKHHYSNQLVCCNKTKCCTSHFFITAMSLYTGTAVTPDESWQCSQTIGGGGTPVKDVSSMPESAPFLAPLHPLICATDAFTGGTEWLESS